MKKTNNFDRMEFNLTSFINKKLELKNNTLYFGSNINVNELSKILNLNPDKIVNVLNLTKRDYSHILNNEQISEICMLNNINFVKVRDISEENIIENINDLLLKNTWKENVIYKKRNPIVTIMGHVDHGKTTLLDVIRNSNIATKEHGNITQKIGAYQIKYHNDNITFIDTPGHEIFTEMRANGSKITDIAVIVVSAEDGIMPQTRESFDHAKSANVPIIIAVNKMDLVKDFDMNKLKMEFANYDILADDLGGDIPFVAISAKNNVNINELIDIILLLSEDLDLNVPWNINGSGVVIESNSSRNKGFTASVIVLNGILMVGDYIIVDDKYVRVKSLIDENNNNLKFATPGQPIEIYGLGFLPQVGTNFVVTKDKRAQKIADTIHNAKLNQISNYYQKNLIFDLFTSLKDTKRELNIILKTDSLGTLNAIYNRFNSVVNDEIKINVIRSDVGLITNSDITLSQASKAIIYQFNQKINPQIEKIIKEKNIKVFSFDVVYHLFEHFNNLLLENQEDKFEEKLIGEGLIIKKFASSKLGFIAGTKVINGSVKVKSIVKVYRDNKFIGETEIKSLKIKNDNVKEVTKGKECGIIFDEFYDFEENDTMFFYVLEKIENK